MIASSVFRTCNPLAVLLGGSGRVCPRVRPSPVAALLRPRAAGSAIPRNDVPRGQGRSSRSARARGAPAP